MPRDAVSCHQPFRPTDLEPLIFSGALWYGRGALQLSYCSSLADALTYISREYKPHTLIDVATLTG